MARGDHRIGAAGGPPRALRALAGVAMLAMLAASPARATWQKFGLAEGLAGGAVRAIAEAKDESIWFATANGACRYDGDAWRTFRMTDGLASDDVRAVAGEAAGRVWLGTGGGASRWDGAVWRNFTTADGLASDDVRALCVDRAGLVWFATGFGVSRFDGAQWTTWRQADGLAGNDVSCVFEDAAGDVWAGTTNGVSRLHAGAWSTWRQAQGLASDAVQGVAESPAGVFWFGTQFGGLSRFDGARWRTIADMAGVHFANVAALRADAAGALWVGGPGGVARFDGTSWRAFSPADGISGSFVSSLAFDTSGDLWAGHENGADRDDRAGVARVAAPQADTWGAGALLEAANGERWVGTSGGGAAKFDSIGWTSFAHIGSGLADDHVAALAEDSTGAVWCGTPAGASRRDAAGAWITFTAADGLPASDVRAIVRDPAARLWFGTTAGVCGYDGLTWLHPIGAGWPAGVQVNALCLDRTGRIWCGTSNGLYSISGGTLTHYLNLGPTSLTPVYAVAEAPSGAIWAGASDGLVRLQDGVPTLFGVADGLAAATVRSVAVDPYGVVWAGTEGGGVSAYDGIGWTTWSTGQGLPDGSVAAVAIAHSGDVWLGTAAGVAVLEPDRVPPQTVVTSAPPALSPGTLQTVHFDAAWREILGIAFSSAFDGGPWSAWSEERVWIGRDLADGAHALLVRARDGRGNVDATPARSDFEIDATPPAPIVTVPASREAVRGTSFVRGTATDARLRAWRLDLRPAGATSWDAPPATMLAQSGTPVANGVLATLATTARADGDWELRLSVTDTLGLTGAASVGFVIDNEPPWADETSPALVRAANGGDVSTTHREAHVYLPPQALSGDATVSLDTVAVSLLPPVLPDGAVIAGAAFAFAVTGAELRKSATLDLALAGLATPAAGAITIYTDDGGAAWRRLGGTLDAASARIATPIAGSARFALYAAGAPPAHGGGGIAGLSLTPRAFSPRGGYASTSVGIGFSLARAGTVRVTVHNRAGRLVREVASGQALGPGQNLIRWDGRDGEGRMVEGGVYLVTVEALGERLVRPLAVVP